MAFSDVKTPVPNKIAKPFLGPPHVYNSLYHLKGVGVFAKCNLLQSPSNFSRSFSSESSLWVRSR
jgi:hypothetical protein